MSRAHFGNTTIKDDVYGSIFIFKATNNSSVDSFDYLDSSVSRCLLLKINEFCIITCFDDCKAGMSFLSETINAFRGNLHPLQLREVLAHLSYINVNLAERPQFQSIHNEENHTIRVIHPESPPYLISKEDQQFQIGDFLETFAKDYFPNDEKSLKLLQEIKNGTRGYLFDSDGKFYNMSTN